MLLLIVELEFVFSIEEIFFKFLLLLKVGVVFWLELDHGYVITIQVGRLFS